MRAIQPGLILAAVLLTSASFAGAAVVARYSFEDGTASDATGGNDGVLRGDPTSVRGRVGAALAFDGQDDFIVVADSPDLHTERLEIALWMRLDGGQTRAVLVEKIGGESGYQLSLRGGRLRFALFDGRGGSVALETAFRVLPRVWVPVTASYDGSSAQIYVFGELAATQPASDLSIASPASLFLGAGRGGQSAFRGLLDEVGLGDSASSARAACTRAGKLWSPAGKCRDTFTDVTSELGLENPGNRAFGSTLVDINRDGWIDLYFLNGAGDPLPSPVTGICPDLTEPPDFVPGSKNALYLNRGDGTFHPDSAEEVGVADEWNAMRHVWGDVDNDGERDVHSHNFVVSNFYGVVSLDPLRYEIQNEERGLEICLTRGTGNAFADVNRDGWLDLYGVEYDPTRPAEDHLNLLYLNDGSGGFFEVTSEAGLDLPDNPMGVAFADYDNDGDQDVFVTNSHEVPSRLYRNDGPQPGSGIPRFTDVAGEAGVAAFGEPDRGVGAAWGDYDNDGDLDLLYTREADTRLYRNDGPDSGWTFTDTTRTGGFIYTDNDRFWGGNFADLDNDGWLDIVLTNREEKGGPNKVFFNNHDGTWDEVAALLGMDYPNIPSQGFVAGDIDNDGDLDVVITVHEDVSDLSFRNYVYRNNEVGNNWVQFRLTGTTSNADAVGARIAIQTRLPGGEGFRQIREVMAGTGFFSDFPRIQTFGLGRGGTAEGVVIFWPNGQQQDLGPVAPNTRHDVLEP